MLAGAALCRTQLVPAVAGFFTREFSSNYDTVDDYSADLSQIFTYLGS